MNCIKRKLIDWGFKEPSTIDIMDKYIRGQLTEDQAKFIEDYSLICVGNDAVAADWNGQLYFVVDRNSRDEKGCIPSCEEFKSNLRRYRGILDEVLVEMERIKKENSDQVKKVNLEKKCKRKMWDNISDVVGK